MSNWENRDEVTVTFGTLMKAQGEAHLRGIVDERLRILTKLKKQIEDCEECTECRVIKWLIGELGDTGVMHYRDLNVSSDGMRITLTAYKLKIDENDRPQIDYDKHTSIRFTIADHEAIVRYFVPDHNLYDDLTDLDQWGSLEELCLNEDAPRSVYDWALEIMEEGY